MLGPKDREGVVVPTFGQPLAVLNHPVENSAGHAEVDFIGRELKRKTRPISIDFVDCLGSNQILREVHIDDPALCIENYKEVVGHGSKFDRDENQLLFGSLTGYDGIFDALHSA